MTKERKDQNGGGWESGDVIWWVFFKFFIQLLLQAILLKNIYYLTGPVAAFLKTQLQVNLLKMHMDLQPCFLQLCLKKKGLYIVGHPFKKYILFGWTYSRVFEMWLQVHLLKSTYRPTAAFSRCTFKKIIRLDLQLRLLNAAIRPIKKRS